MTKPVLPVVLALVLAGFAATWVPPARAQGPNAVPAPTPGSASTDAAADLYGLAGTGAKWIAATRFVPAEAAAPLRHEGFAFYTNPGSAVPERYAADIDDVPIGGLIESFTCVFQDSSATNDMLFQLVRPWQAWRAIVTVRGMETLASVSTVGAPGIGHVDAAPSPPPLVQHVLSTPFRVTQQFQLTADVAADTSFAGCLVIYRLAISHAPATASFSDVPASHPFFQVIEALKASGITAGCGTGAEFCPDAPVTRAAMAAFLARALGLFFPF